MVKIRLTRTGRKHYHTFRIVAAESTSPRDGRFIEILGHYNPNLANNDENKVVIKKERIEHWLGKGAQPSHTVWTLLRKQGINKATARETRKKLSGASA
ncbi:MAG: 30S ribosomal protein S16 [Planctomycetes bacterium]|nr:30S ribosomal protein S16 [Planctomycetota bacterium]MCA8937586.1 30S ribosomal protein S16 [Planctomycetota bacterium]MCA8947350.1 30S ribosomal protein S16 [Planctomycetota bacterium]